MFSVHAYLSSILLWLTDACDHGIALKLVLKTLNGHGKSNKIYFDDSTNVQLWNVLWWLKTSIITNQLESLILMDTLQVDRRVWLRIAFNDFGLTWKKKRAVLVNICESRVGADHCFDYHESELVVKRVWVRAYSHNVCAGDNNGSGAFGMFGSEAVGGCAF